MRVVARRGVSAGSAQRVAADVDVRRRSRRARSGTRASDRRARCGSRSGSPPASARPAPPGAAVAPTRYRRVRRRPARKKSGTVPKAVNAATARTSPAEFENEPTSEQRGDEDERDAAREVDRTEDATLRRCRLPPAADEQRRALRGRSAGRATVKTPRRIPASSWWFAIRNGLLGQPLQSSNLRSKTAGSAPARNAVVQSPATSRRSSVDASRPSGNATIRWTNAARNRLPKSAAMPRTQREFASQKELTIHRKPIERQQPAGAVLGPERPGDQAAEDERQPDHGQDDGHRRRVRLVIALGGQDRADDRKRDEHREGAEPEPVHGCELQHCRSGALLRRPPRARSSGETRMRRCRPRAGRSR